MADQLLSEVELRLIKLTAGNFDSLARLTLFSYFLCTFHGVEEYGVYMSEYCS